MLKYNIIFSTVSEIITLTTKTVQNICKYALQQEIRSSECATSPTAALKITNYVSSPNIGIAEF